MYIAALAWLLAPAYVDGSAGISRALGNPYEYLETARATTDVSAMLREYVDRIPLPRLATGSTHVAGHPPGASSSLWSWTGWVSLVVCPPGFS